MARTSDMSDAQFDALFDAGSGAESDAGPGAGPQPPHRRQMPRHKLPIAGVFLAVAVCAAVFARGSGVGDPARGLHGGLDQMGSAPGVRWSVPMPPGADVLSTRFGVVITGDGLTAYDRDGAVRWHTAGPGPRYSCMPHLGQEAADRIVCVSRDVLNEISVVTVDPATGAVTGPRVRQANGYAATLVDGDLIRAQLEASGASISREDPGTGAPVWQRQLRPVAKDGSGRTPRTRSAPVALDVSQGVVSVFGATVQGALTVNGDLLVNGGAWTAARLPSGLYAGNRYGDRSLFVFAAEGSRKWRGEGRVLEPALSDGSAPGVLVVGSIGGVLGLNARTGTVLWRTQVPAYAEVLRAGGTIVLRGEQRFWALDMATGRLLWSAGVDGETIAAPMSDGRSLILSVSGRDRADRLMAVSLRTGAAVWQAPLPRGTQHIFAAHQQIYALTPISVVAMDG